MLPYQRNPHPKFFFSFFHYVLERLFHLPQKAFADLISQCRRVLIRGFLFSIFPQRGVPNT